MNPKRVIKRVKLPLKTCARLRREARGRSCSISALVAAAVRRDLEEKRELQARGGKTS
ncbi:MAG TPA: hypothetical protein VG838_01665 [Opitutaceae bacterium]|nr:hypothetical protein [Opitutaceae bacterium]